MINIGSATLFHQKWPKAVKKCGKIKKERKLWCFIFIFHRIYFSDTSNISQTSNFLAIIGVNNMKKILFIQKLFFVLCRSRRSNLSKIDAVNNSVSLLNFETLQNVLSNIFSNKVFVMKETLLLNKKIFP